MCRAPAKIIVPWMIVRSMYTLKNLLVIASWSIENFRIEGNWRHFARKLSFDCELSSRYRTNSEHFKRVLWPLTNWKNTALKFLFKKEWSMKSERGCKSTKKVVGLSVKDPRYLFDANPLTVSDQSSQVTYLLSSQLFSTYRGTLARKLSIDR